MHCEKRQWRRHANENTPEQNASIAAWQNASYTSQVVLEWTGLPVGEVYSALNGPMDWIPQFTRTYLYFFHPTSYLSKLNRLSYLYQLEVSLCVNGIPVRRQTDTLTTGRTTLGEPVME